MKKLWIFTLILIISIFCYSNNFKVYAKEPRNKEVQMNKEFTQVRASHLLVKTKEEADKIREEILAGKDFAEAAREVSLCPSGKQGGDLGYFGRGQMVAEFEEACYDAEKEGDLMKVCC